MTIDYSELMKPWYEQVEARKPPVQSAPSNLSEAEELEVIHAHTRAIRSLQQALLG